MSASLHYIDRRDRCVSRLDETKVVLLGNNLTGSTSVDFNGMLAAFTVISPTEIEATVPTGAITGKITVATKTGTLTSNAVFRVTK